MGNAVVKLGMAGMDATNDYALARKNLVVGEENAMIQLVNARAICHGKAVYAMSLDCYGHGEWNITTSICRCENGFKGDMCNLKACPINRLTQVECSGHGICNVTDGACECNAGFTGRNCEAPFVLLPRRNHSWKDGVRYGGNETIDSFARKLMR